MNPFTCSGRLGACALGLFLSATVLEATSAVRGWPNWRGPHENGSVDSGRYPAALGESNLVWKVALPGKGSSTPIVWEDRIYLTAPDDGQDTVLALDLNGQRKWQRHLGPEAPPKHRTLGSSCNASPVTDGQSIYVYFKSGLFAALNMDGTVRWQTNLVQRFGREQLFWDQGTSPTLTEQHVILTRLHSGESWIAAFDKTTGELRWQQARNYSVPTENDNGYSTPVHIRHQDRPALLVWGADHLTAHDAGDGKLLWSCGGFNPQATDFWPAIATPVLVGTMVVVPVGRDDRRQASLHGIKLGGSGDVTKTHRAWKRDGLGVFVCSPAAFKDRVYLLRHRGEIACVNPADGETIWSESLPRHNASYFSSPVIANGVLYAAREDGTVFAVRVENKFELLSETPLGERVIASPVPVHDRVLIRSDQHLFCFGSR